MKFIISKEDFEKHKQEMNGRVFWKEEKDKIAIKMVAPFYPLKQLLISLSEKIKN